jgi:hypothetical protein
MITDFEFDKIDMYLLNFYGIRYPEKAGGHMVRSEMRFPKEGKAFKVELRSLKHQNSAYTSWLPSLTGMIADGYGVQSSLDGVITVTRKNRAADWQVCDVATAKEMTIASMLLSGTANPAGPDACKQFNPLSKAFLLPSIGTQLQNIMPKEYSKDGKPQECRSAKQCETSQNFFQCGQPGRAVQYDIKDWGCKWEPNTGCVPETGPNYVCAELPPKGHLADAAADILKAGEAVGTAFTSWTGTAFTTAASIFGGKRR